MLRVFFKGPGGTLSGAVLDVAEEQRHLDLGPIYRRPLRQAMIMQTHSCVPCRQRYRQPQSGRPVLCKECSKECERVIIGIRVPSPRYAKAWDRFWAQYRAEKALLDAYANNEVSGPITLELFDVRLPRR
jgi:DNA-directed RNA polymerase subunit RPC12/RpoP